MTGRVSAALALAVLALAALAGCGYTLGGTLPSHIRTVAVPIFANRTSEPAVEGLITRAVVEAFSTNGRLRVVPAAEADSILEGEIIRYEVDSVAFDPAANVRQYRLTVRLHLRFRDVRQNRVLFEEGGMEERADFRVSGAVPETVAREEAALRTAAVDIARTVVNLAIARF